jgi:type II secretory ATPase GspE/PulE/Tfp pilus assembly ATPase PilB-like protein
MYKASDCGLHSVDLHDVEIEKDLLDLFPTSALYEHLALPYKRDGDCILVAVGDPFDFDLISELSLATGKVLRAVVADPQEISKQLKKHLGVASSVLGALEGNQEEDLDDGVVFGDSSTLDNISEQRSVAKLVTELLEDAVHQGASDVHLENGEDEFQVRYRVDGMLRSVSFPPSMMQFRSALVSRIKILAKLNIAEKRLPQDGRFKATILDRPTDIRVSIIPMLHGENVVMRLLDRGRSVVSIEGLEIPSPQDEEFLELIKQPNGIILITGPTGSGKTTTLYSALSAIHKPTIKIVTIEDPVEYSLPGIHQIQVQEKIGRTFANGLRSILRHDPDVVLVGEIRDKETAQSAMQASLTGHLVLSTLHTNDACGAIPRLVDMGIEPFLVASTLQCVMAQRLVRKLCPTCKILSDHEHAPLPADFPGDTQQVFQGTGCRECQGTGYRGRLAIFELLNCDTEIRKLTGSGSDANTIRQHALHAGMKTLRQSGWEAVAAGKTTINEILRLTGSPDELQRDLK